MTTQDRFIFNPHQKAPPSDNFLVFYNTFFDYILWLGVMTYNNGRYDTNLKL